MTVFVPRDFPFPSRSGIASGKPVRAAHMRQIGDALAYLKGHGHTVLPAMRLSSVAIPPGTTYLYGAMLFDKPWMRHLVWTLRPRVIAAGGFCAGTFTSPTGATFGFTAMESEPEVRPIVSEVRFVEALTAAPAGAYFGDPSLFAIENDAASTDDLYIDVVQCIALPRETLEMDADDVGVDPGTLGPDVPLYDAEYGSIGGLSRVIADGEDTNYSGLGTRALFAWARPHGQGIAVTSAWADVFEEGPCVQPHHRFRSETMRAVWCNCTGFVDTAGDTIEVRFTAASGDTITETIVDTSSGSWGFPTRLDVYAEDLSTSDGRRASTDEIIRIEVRCTGAGTQTGHLEGLSLIDGVAV